MAENENFYTDALKAFDAPAPEPEELSAAAEETAPAPRETRRYRFSPWWFAALAVVLCLVLVIVLIAKDPSSRGEHYVYGFVEEATEEYLILNEGGEYWYVDLNGLQMPEHLGDSKYTVWVFYNGEAKKTDQNNCTKRVTATCVKELNRYGWSDEIQFDLDGDGQKELWTFTAERYESSGDSPVLHKIKLLAKDQQGNILHNVYFLMPQGNRSVLFHDEGGKLSLLLYQWYQDDHYETVDIRLKKGELVAYRGKEALEVHKPVQEDRYAIQFVAPRYWGEKISLSIEEGTELKHMLDSLEWVDAEGVERDVFGHFKLFCADENTYYYDELTMYNFVPGGILQRGNKLAKTDLQLQLWLQRMMGWEMPAQQDYAVKFNSGKYIVVISFHPDGTVVLKQLDELGAVQQTYTGLFVTLGKYYYLDMGEQLEHRVVLCWEEGSFEYVKELSAQSIFPTKFYAAIHFKPA